MPLLSGTEFAVTLQQTESQFRILADPRDKEKYRMEIVKATLLVEAFFLTDKVYRHVVDQVATKNYTMSYKSSQFITHNIPRNSVRKTYLDLFDGPLVPSKVTAFLVPTDSLEGKSWELIYCLHIISMGLVLGHYHKSPYEFRRCWDKNSPDDLVGFLAFEKEAYESERNKYKGSSSARPKRKNFALVSSKSGADSSQIGEKWCVSKFFGSARAAEREGRQLDDFVVLQCDSDDSVDSDDDLEELFAAATPPDMIYLRDMSLFRNGEYPFVIFYELKKICWLLLPPGNKVDAMQLPSEHWDDAAVDFR